MRLRLLAFVPPAALVSAGLLISASSLVSALEAQFKPNSVPVITIERFQSRCDVLDQEIEILSRAATSCDRDLECLDSPILCPIAMDEAAEREYRALREERKLLCDTGRDEPRPLWSGVGDARTLSRFDVSRDACPTSPIGSGIQAGEDQYLERDRFVF